MVLMKIGGHQGQAANAVASRALTPSNLHKSLSPYKILLRGVLHLDFERSVVFDLFWRVGGLLTASKRQNLPDREDFGLKINMEINFYPLALPLGVAPPSDHRRSAGLSLC